MKEINNRRQVDIAKSILESKGYKVGKRLKESVSSYTLEDLKRLLQLDEETGYELYLIPQPKNEEIPFAWDAGIDVEGDRVVIRGGIGPGGAYDRSSVEINTSLRTFQKFYTLAINHNERSIESLGLSDEDIDFIWSMCESY